MPDALAAIACALASASVGFVCGLIVGRDTRIIVQTSRRESRSLALTNEPTMPPIIDIVAPLPVVMPSDIRTPAPAQDKPDPSGPIYIHRVTGLEGWHYATEAVELGDGRLWKRTTWCGGKLQVSEWVCEPGEWARVQ